MKTYDYCTNATELLLNLELYIRSLSQRGPTFMSVYLENFAAKIMGIFYNYEFINMNYRHKNFARIDLYNEEYNHAVQFTTERNNSEKVIKSIENSSRFHKITVFFFNSKKTETIIKHVKEKGLWKDNVEVISLYDILSLIEQEPDKARELSDICDLWIKDLDKINLDIIEILNTEMLKLIQANKNSKKYIPEIYIPEVKLKKLCRFFVDKEYADNKLLFNINHYFSSDYIDKISQLEVVFKDGKRISYLNDCDIRSELEARIISPSLIDVVVRKLNNFVKLSSGFGYGGNSVYLEGREVPYYEVHAKYQNSLGFTVDNDLFNHSLSDKKYFFIVKDAGQGKTNFLCDFCENVLAKRRIPTIYINVNQLTGTLWNKIKDHLSFSLNTDFHNAFTLLKEYCEVTAKKLIIVIDGLNEKNNLPVFRNEVLELYRNIEEFNFVKIIATSRNLAYDSFFKDFKDESFGSLIFENIESYEHIYGRKDDEFRNKVFEKYKAYFNFTCYISKSAKNRLTNDLLLLRLFSEVYENNSDSIVNDIYLFELFNDYIKKRSKELLLRGKIKRTDDLNDVLKKIASVLIETREVNAFSYSGFTSEEKDLIDTIVEEDILIKTNESKNDFGVFNNSTFCFTYDEYRDYLISLVLLKYTEDEFKKMLEYMDQNSERFDGVLKYLFIVCKTYQNSKMSFIESTINYNKIYSNNIFSVKDEALNEEDIALINHSMHDPKMKWIFSYICRRLDTQSYKKLSILNVVACYLEGHYNSYQWKDLFIEKDFYTGKLSGLLIDLIKEKKNDTTPNEVYGMILFLCTFGYFVTWEISEYIEWLYQSYPDAFENSIDRIVAEYPLFRSIAIAFSEEVKE